ncbi:MAG: hypothetical protein N2C12_06360, partial [Planctomycetales bacterium]
GWQPVSDRKIRVGIAGYGLCKFGAAFFYQNHPNVEVVAATDLDPGRLRRTDVKRSFVRLNSGVPHDEFFDWVTILDIRSGTLAVETQLFHDRRAKVGD